MTDHPTPLTILTIADPHFVGTASHTCDHPKRQARLGQILLRKTLWRLKHLGVKPDLIVLLGDMVDDATKPGAQEDLQSLAGEVHKTGIRVLAIPGNHDGDPARFAQVFGCAPGMHLIGDYVFLVFHDQRQDGEFFRRPSDQLDLPARAAAAYPGRPIIALQHHPHDPVIREGYPYHLTNRAEVMAGYRDAGVCLSLSGHYHAGQAAHMVDGVTYATAPALCESPFRFLLIRMEGRRAQVQEHALRHDVPGLADNHCHTELAYCGTSASIADGIRISQVLGVETLCFTEHTFQLYFERDEAWSFQWQRDPAMKQAVWSTPERGRMASYRWLAAGFRTNRVRAGLEVDLCADGSLLLAPQDADGWDLLVGAVHEIPEVKKGVTSQAETEEFFLRDVKRLLAHPIDVLAHPFRFFPRKGLQKPAHLYPVVADLLAASGVAAEINFHTHQSEPEFFRHCLERGVKISLASDSHELSEYGEFTPHLRVLAEAGAAPDDIPRILLRPRNPGSAGVPPATRKEPREWHSRGYLPHFDHPGLVQSITFRLADSLPMEVVLRLSQQKTAATDADAVELRKAVESALDHGVGACHLKNPQVAQIVQDALLHFDGERYRLLAWVVMPNHVHIMIETLPGFRLDEVVHSWKSYTAKVCNRLLGRTGAFWEAEYFDRFIRNTEHFRKTRVYIEENPVKAHLAAKAGDWVFSSVQSTGSAGGTPALPYLSTRG